MRTIGDSLALKSPNVRMEFGFELIEKRAFCNDSLELKVDTCVSCHEGVTTAEDARNIRFAASLVDYDGDGDTEEGIYYEVEGARETLYTAMQAYASEVAKAPWVTHKQHILTFLWIPTPMVCWMRPKRCTRMPTSPGHPAC